MKPKEGVVDLLNRVLTAELTALHQYLLHASMCDNWGYERLRHEFRERGTEEVDHASQLMDHILYLEGKPDMQRLGTVKGGDSIPELLNADLALEQEDVKLLQEAINHCAKVGDYTTRHKLEDMIKESEEHIDWIETQQRTIKQVGLENYLSEQIKKEGS
ncbi:bacterioferritin [Candidatus Nitrospira bockiana]